jgi:hypothetical protein
MAGKPVVTDAQLARILAPFNDAMFNADTANKSGSPRLFGGQKPDLMRLQAKCLAVKRIITDAVHPIFFEVFSQDWARYQEMIKSCQDIPNELYKKTIFLKIQKTTQLLSVDTSTEGNVLSFSAADLGLCFELFGKNALPLEAKKIIKPSEVSLSDIGNLLKIYTYSEDQKYPNFYKAVTEALQVVQECLQENRLQKVSASLSDAQIIQVLAPLQKYAHYFHSPTRHHQQSCHALIESIRQSRDQNDVFQVLEDMQFDTFEGEKPTEKAGFYHAITQARKVLTNLLLKQNPELSKTDLDTSKEVKGYKK